MSLMIGLVFQILERLTKFNCRIAKMFVRHYGIAVFFHFLGLQRFH